MQLGGVLATELLCSLKVCEKVAVLLESLMVNVRGAYKSNTSCLRCTWGTSIAPRYRAIPRSY